MSLQTKVAVVESVEFLVMALALFLPAGTIAWPARLGLPGSALHLKSAYHLVASQIRSGTH